MRQDALFINNADLLGELKLPELRLPERQTEQPAQTRQSATAGRGIAARSTRTRSASRPLQTGGRTSPANAPRQTTTAAQPALDFRGSDYEGALPPTAPAEIPEDSATDTTLAAADQGIADPPGDEAGAPELPETGPAPAARQRNTRSNPVISDEEFVLELPDYNPLLE
jgi:hypothetical protein